MLTEAQLDSKTSWRIAVVSLCCLAMAFGAPLVATIGLKAIAADLGGARAVPALASSLTWLGSALGGPLMGRIAHRFGVRTTVVAGGIAVCLGLGLSSFGAPWQLYLGHGLLVGFLGIAGLNAPLYVYVSNWFDRRRGSALALLSSGIYIAGVVWPVIFETTIARWGWRATMIGYGLLEVLVIVALASRFLRPPPQETKRKGGGRSGTGGSTVFGWRPNRVFGMLCGAAFLCCIPMAMPQGHLVALCSDRGIPSALGAVMLSSLLAAAFVSRQAWGLVADRIGGLRTVFISSALQMLAVSGYLYVSEQFGLFTVSVAFGLGFSAIIPAYVLAVRENFTPEDAHWRVPIVLMMTGSGMAAGGWLAGFLYDRTGSYDLPFLVAVLFNVANLVLLGTLVTLSIKAARRAAFV
ncbi:MFS transporter [Achromobacter pulmonis]|nr:MFS transporter [Achromobacter pulmonis]